ncbi:unnamed protein product [Rhizopus stolonifer]
MSVKTSVANIRWKETLRPVSNEFVFTVNDIVTHTFAFSKFIFIKEFDKDKDFDLEKYATKSFFQEVFLSLVERQVRDGKSSGDSSTFSEKVRQIKSLIYTHKDEYLRQTLYAPIKLTNAQQIALYEDTKIYRRHLRAFYFLAKICEEGKIKSFNCFPLRKSLIPCYITIDTKILDYHVLKNKSFAAGQKFDLWGSVIDLECKAIKSQCSGVMNFEGTIETDGVGISVIKQNFNPARGGALSGDKKD